MGGRRPREFQRLEDVPTNGEFTVPEELTGIVYGQTCAGVDVAFLQFVVGAHDVGVEGKRLRQVVQVLRLDDVEPLRLALHVLERLPRLVLWRVVVRHVGFPLLVVLIDNHLAFLVALAVRVTEGEVGGVVWHRLSADIVGLPVRKREVLVLRHRLCERAQRVALCPFQFVEGVLEQHVRVEGVVLRRNLLVTVGVIHGQLHLPFLGEEFAQFKLGGDAPLVQVVIAALVHALLQTTETSRLHVTCEVHVAEVRELHVQITLRSPTAFVVVVLHTQFVHPHFDRTCAAAVVAYTNHHGLDLAQRRITHDADLVRRTVAVVDAEHLRVCGLTLAAGLVALVLHAGEHAEVYVKHVLSGPYSLTTLSGVGVVVACRRKFERNLVLVVVALVVATHTQEDAHLVVLQLVVSFEGVGVDKHLQMLVVAQVERHGLIDGTRIAWSKILDGERERLLVFLCELRLLRVGHTADARWQDVVDRAFVVILLDVDRSCAQRTAHARLVAGEERLSIVSPLAAYEVQAGKAQDDGLGTMCEVHTHETYAGEVVDGADLRFVCIDRNAEEIP